MVYSKWHRQTPRPILGPLWIRLRKSKRTLRYLDFTQRCRRWRSNPSTTLQHVRATYPLPKKEGGSCDVSVFIYYLFLNIVRYKTPTLALHFDIHLSHSLSLFTMIPRSARRPTRRQTRNLLGSMSLVFFTVLALILLCPVAVNAADEDKKAEFGTVIGIGM